ncbi:MAG: hypothetical protein M3Y77_10190 [Actinomycetota bacterium]|nr:hypothetical protein [Actinomycetota bacterium]
MNASMSEELVQLVSAVVDGSDSRAQVLVDALRQLVKAERRNQLLHPEATASTKDVLEYRLRAELFEAGVRDGYPVKDAAAIARLSQSRVRHLLSDGSWPTVKPGPGSVVVPRFVFTPDGAELPAIRRVSQAARAAGWDVYTLASFLNAPQEFLEDHTPRQWLTMGADPEAVLTSIGEPG